MRRPVMIVVWLALTAAGVMLSPLLLLAGAVASAVIGRRQPLLLVEFGLSYLVRESAVILACGGLWLGSGFGLRLRSERFTAAHYRLLGWLLGGLVRQARATLRIDIDLDDRGEAGRALRDRRPLLLFSRHAGPGDSLLIVDLLLNCFGRRPRIVMKEILGLDPCVDLICHRLPNALLDTDDRERCAAEIGELASGLDRDGVLLLFPEGGNFTPERRRTAIQRLWREARGRQASRAEELEHVMAPRPLGALAALQANPGADVIFSAHTGLGHQAFASELWRQLPTGRTLQMRMWLAPAADRPTDSQGQMDWLYGWWERIDEWIAQQGSERAAVG
jgi:1-acyl-sn-glycerol-3-phosphate acyltransferase